ncbi:LPS export ABC transporter periplasmic protein LptC [Halomonas eurihalina]|uniref:LPS export ABC transporter periplasmic protein LptC n=1 Tax=Halomonas eurihalina TaxID=42566 RepID=A0A5D9CV52_HALER|nr:LPS export ABC transporter periplasmic protein LptC [Halomonas eurihalina]MDR5859621.1 LPS export ABC transporter periplasmic protein LptC [Halomonas eurihalina]TZG35276.1 LPS export ABC transporter periplasmic protein LptC [Halomonas eurihalina]
MQLPRPGFRTWLFLLLLALGGGLTVLDLRDDDAPGPVPRDAAGEPDYYLEDVEATRFDAEGYPHQRLDTPRLVHTPIDDVTRLENPDVKLRDDDGRHWTARSEQGRLETGGNPLILSGDVRLEAPREHWQLSTQRLHYDADTGHAWSDTPATLSQPPQSMQGDRFDAWLHDNRARLTDNVRGHHPPATDKDPES